MIDTFISLDYGHNADINVAGASRVTLQSIINSHVCVERDSTSQQTFNIYVYFSITILRIYRMLHALDARAVASEENSNLPSDIVNILYIVYSARSVMQLGRDVYRCVTWVQ